jgi:transposase
MEVLHPRCAGLDVHRETVVACVRIVSGGEVSRAVRTFETTTAGLIELAKWLEASGCRQAAVEATGVYWKPVWQVLAGGGWRLGAGSQPKLRTANGTVKSVKSVIPAAITQSFFHHPRCASRSVARVCAPGEGDAKSLTLLT